ncbi:LEA_2 domain-containing protein [Psidium guajava]|nr:LEA_2 domain-containing protein [Psidium guajava]
MTTRANGDHRARPPPSSHDRHQYYYPSSSSSSASLKGCCCCLFLLFSFLALLVVAVVLIIVLAVKPKKPQFDLQQVGVQYMGISPSDPATAAAAAAAATAGSSPTSASLSLNIRMLFLAVNPNKVGIRYGESRFTVMYKGIPLGKASVPGFFQEAHSERQVVATIAVDRFNLMQADASDLIRDASLNDRVELRVLGDVGAKIRVLNIDSPGVQVSVNCAVVISPSKQSLTYKQCGFDGLRV